MLILACFIEVAFRSPDSVVVNDGVLDIWMYHCEFVRVNLSSSKDERERVLDGGIVSHHSPYSSR